MQKKAKRRDEGIPSNEATVQFRESSAKWSGVCVAFNSGVGFFPYK